MARCLISLGANIGNAAETIRQAADELKRQLGDKTVDFRLSRLFKTPPVGGPSGQPPFVNAVAAFETQWDPWQVWALIRKVESAFGRSRNQRWEARKLDLDILLFGPQRIWTPQLKVPHPRMCMRRFILVPAVDVARNWIDPVSGWTIDRLAAGLRTQPASVVLLASNPSSAIPILSEAARLAVADWRVPGSNAETQSCEPNSARNPIESSNVRWVSLGQYHFAGDAAMHVTQPSVRAQLRVWLAPCVTAEGGAWEDYHFSLAESIGLVDGAVSPTSLEGPRYLLASDDRQWAVHELVAALEAMDCPVEPLS